MARRSAKEAKTTGRERQSYRSARERRCAHRVVEAAPNSWRSTTLPSPSFAPTRQASPTTSATSSSASEETAHAMRNLNGRFIDELRKARDEANLAKAASDGVEARERRPKTSERRPSATPRRLALNKRLISEMKDARAASRAKSESARRELERQKLAAVACSNPEGARASSNSTWTPGPS